MEQLTGNSDSILYLQGFAPLIQLWAGICLLFFYESLLNKSPFTALCDDIHNLYKIFINQYNGLIPDETISFNEYIKDYWNHDLVPTINCTASTCFFYSVFILAFIGIEECADYGGNYYCALQITNSFIWIFLIGATLFNKYRLFHGFVPSIVLIIVILIYFHFHFQINGFCLKYISFGEAWSHSTITIYTVFTCISGIILVCFLLSVSWLALRLRRWSLRKVNKEFKVFVEYNLGIIGRNQLPKNKLKKILNRCNEKFTKEDIDIIDNDAFLKEMKRVIADEYKDFTNKWWRKLL